MIFGYGVYYQTNYYHGEKTATDLLNGTDNVSVVKTSNGLFLDGGVDGANHAQFAYYGKQTGDGQANISSESQQNQTVQEILNFINDHV